MAAAQDHGGNGSELLWLRDRIDRVETRQSDHEAEQAEQYGRILAETSGARLAAQRAADQTMAFSQRIDDYVRVHEREHAAFDRRIGAVEAKVHDLGEDTHDMSREALELRAHLAEQKAAQLQQELQAARKPKSDPPQAAVGVAKWKAIATIGAAFFAGGGTALLIRLLGG